MKQFKLTTIVSVLSLLAPIAAGAKELRMALYVSERHPAVKLVYEPFINAVKEKSNSSLTIKLFANAQLGKDADQLQMVESGVADIAQIVTVYTKGRFPMTDVANLPFAFRSAKEGAVVLNELRDQYLESEFSTVKLLSVAITAPYQLLTVKAPVKTVEDLDGLRIRGSGGAEVLTNFGASLVSMPITDTYLALERGAVDATGIPFGSMFAYKFEEVTKYANVMNLYSLSLALIINEKTWEGLTPEEQSVLKEVALEFALNTADSQDGSADLATEKAESLGLEVSIFPEAELAKLEASSQPYYDKWVAALKEKGAPADEFLKAITAATTEYRKSNTN